MSLRNQQSTGRQGWRLDYLRKDTAQVSKNEGSNDKEQRDNEERALQARSKQTIIYDQYIMRAIHDLPSSRSAKGKTWV